MEYFDILNPDGTVSGRVKERSLVHRDGDFHRTVHIWLARRNGAGEVELLLQKRCRTKDAYPGCYDISSAGHIQAGEEPLPSAVRELEEELGISVKEEELQFVFLHDGIWNGEFYGKPFRNHELAWTWVLAWDGEPEELTLQPEEVESVRWMSLKALERVVASGDPGYCIFPSEYEKLAGVDWEKLLHS